MLYSQYFVTTFELFVIHLWASECMDLQGWSWLIACWCRLIIFGFSTFCGRYWVLLKLWCPQETHRAVSGRLFIHLGFFLFKKLPSDKLIHELMLETSQWNMVWPYQWDLVSIHLNQGRGCYIYLTYLPLAKWSPFHRWHFQMPFLEGKTSIFYQNVTEVCS